MKKKRTSNLAGNVLRTLMVFCTLWLMTSCISDITTASDIRSVIIMLFASLLINHWTYNITHTFEEIEDSEFGDSKKKQKELKDKTES